MKHLATTHTFKYKVVDNDPKYPFSTEGTLPARCYYTACMEVLNRCSDITEIHPWGPTNIMIQPSLEGEKTAKFQVTWFNVSRPDIKGNMEVTIEKVDG